MVKSSPLTPAERQFAESRKYGEVLILLVLPSGRFCIMGAGRKPEGAYLADTPLSDLEATQPTVTRCEPRLREVFVADPSLNLDFDL